MKVGIFGGTFDPIHNGHLKLATAALRQLKLDRLYFVVSPRSPFKAGRKKSSARDRLSLVRLAIQRQPRMKAVDWEMKRSGLSYTVTTLRAYRRQHPSHQLFLITGTDALRGFGRWHRPEEIARLATLVAGRRPGAAWPRMPTRLGAKVHRLRGLFPNVSSTKLRRDLSAGRQPRGLPVAVYQEIVRRGFYR